MILDSKGRFIDKHGNARTNAGPNAPEYKTWIEEKGGLVKYDETTDTVIYIKQNMTTSKFGTRDVNIPYRIGEPDGLRYPVFDEFAVETVNIPNMKGLPESKIDLPEVGDFSKAWDEIAKIKGDKYVTETYGIKRRSKGARKGTWPDNSPRGYTLHHHGDGNRIQLVDLEIHKWFTHAGGASASR